MIEAVSATAYALGFLLLFCLVGSAPAVWLARRLRGGLALAPVIGFAIASCVLSTAAAVIPMREAAWAVLLPAALVSAGAAGWRLARTGWPTLSGALWPALVVAAGLLLGLLPVYLSGRIGPTAIRFDDSWLYIFTDEWFQAHTYRAAQPSIAPGSELTSWIGWFVTALGLRPGIFAIEGAGSTLFMTPLDELHLAFLASILALLPLGVWVVARELGASRRAAALGSMASVSPVVLVVAGDSADGNLAAVMLVAPLVLVTVRALQRGGPRLLILSAILLGGMVASFVEFVPVALSAIVAIMLVHLLTTRPGRRAALRTAGQLVLVGVGAAAAAPAALWLTPRWVEFIAGQGDLQSFFPSRFLTVENGLGWATGLAHTYELTELGDLPTAVVVGGIVLSLLIIAVVLAGGWSRGPVTAAIVIAPLVASCAYAAWASARSDGCQYCGWKSMTMLPPFFGVGLALGIGMVAAFVRSRANRQRTIAAVSALLVAAVAAAAVGRSTASLIDLWRSSPRTVETDLRDLTSRVAALPGSPTVLLEGHDATSVPSWRTATLYYLVRRGGATISAETSAAALIVSSPLASDNFLPDYGYVVSAFPGMRTDRTLIARVGDVVLQRRPPVDVSVMRTGWAIDPDDGARAIPWISAGFQLWIASPEPRLITLRVGYERPLGPTSTVSYSFATVAVPAIAEGPDRDCLEIPVPAGRTIIQATAHFSVPPPILFRGTSTGLVGPPPRGLGIRAVTVQGGHCSAPGTPRKR